MQSKSNRSPKLWPSFSIDEFQRNLIDHTVKEHGGDWAAAARSLGLHRSNLHHLATRLGLK